MQSEPLNLPKNSPENVKHHFFQPLAIAFVCFIFIMLFLVMGNLQLKSMEQNLIMIMQSRAQPVIQSIQKKINRFYEQLMWNKPDAFDQNPAASSTPYSFEREESFLFELLNLAREIDFKAENMPLDIKRLNTLCMEENFAFIGVLDKRGSVRSASRPFPESVLQFASPVILGEREFRTNLFSRDHHLQKPLLIVFKRRYSSGSLIIGLNENGFEQIQFQFAASQVLEQTAFDNDVAYFIITDHKGRTIDISGHIKQLAEYRQTPDKQACPPINKISTLKIVTDTHNIFESTAIFKIKDNLQGYVQLGLVMDEADRMLQENRRNIILSVVFMVSIAILAMVLLHFNQKRYLIKMREMEKRMHQAEKLSSLGRLAAAVAHEIRNPLNAISMGIQKIGRDTDHPLIRVIRDEIHRLNLIIEEFLNISKSRKLHLQPCDLQRLLEPVIQLISEDAAAKGIRIIEHWPSEKFTLVADMDKIKQAFINILKNAIESITGEGEVHIRLHQKNPRQAMLSIADTGSGLLPEEIDHIFDFDYTTKDKGVGLGLPLAHEIIQAHGGDITVKSEAGNGSVFDIMLPLKHQ